MANGDQFDPVAEYRKAYTDDPRSDEQIAQKLKDPANFRKAFPDYDYSAPDADQRISAHMNDYYRQRFTGAPGSFQTKKGGPIYNAKTLHVDTAPQEAEASRAAGAGRELALGALSGFSGMPESAHPLQDLAEQYKKQNAEMMEHPIGFALHQANPFSGIGQIYELGKGLYGAGKEMGQGALESLRHTGEDAEGLSGPERFAHGLGSMVGRVAQLAAAREAPEAAEEQSLIPKVAGKVKPHLVEELGHTHTVTGRLAKMAAEKALPDTPEEIARRTRAAEEAKAADINQAVKIQDVENRRVAREKAATERETARQERQKAREQERQGKPVPIRESPNFDMEAYRQGVAQRTTPAEEGIPKIQQPEAGPQEAAISEGRPATWTNERVMELARQGNRDAIAQVGRRGLVLPENTRYVAGDVDFPRIVLNPREVTRFTPEGTPITQEGPIGRIEQAPLRYQGRTENVMPLSEAGNVANEFLKGKEIPEVEIGGEEGTPNASGESSASREAISRSASEKAKGVKRYRIDTRSGNETELHGVDAVDATPGKYEVIVTRGPLGEIVLDRGSHAHYRGRR